MSVLFLHDGRVHVLHPTRLSPVSSAFLGRAHPSVTACAPATSTMQVLGPATENIDISWMTQIFEGGALQHLDQITVHPYRPDSPETVLVAIGETVIFC